MATVPRFEAYTFFPCRLGSILGRPIFTAEGVGSERHSTRQAVLMAQVSPGPTERCLAIPELHRQFSDPPGIGLLNSQHPVGAGLLDPEEGVTLKIVARYFVAGDVLHGVFADHFEC